MPETEIPLNNLITDCHELHRELPDLETGAEVSVISLPDWQNFIQVLAATPQGGGLLQPEIEPSGEFPFQLPTGWAIRTEKFAIRTTIHLPHPTKALFFKNGASFRGPVESFAAS